MYHITTRQHAIRLLLSSCVGHQQERARHEKDGVCRGTSYLHLYFYSFPFMGCRCSIVDPPSVGRGWSIVNSNRIGFQVGSTQVQHIVSLRRRLRHAIHCSYLSSTKLCYCRAIFSSSSTDAPNTGLVQVPLQSIYLLFGHREQPCGGMDVIDAC